MISDTNQNDGCEGGKSADIFIVHVTYQDCDDVSKPQSRSGTGDVRLGTEQGCHAPLMKHTTVGSKDPNTDEILAHCP